MTETRKTEESTWRQYPPLVQAKSRLAELEKTILELNARIGPVNARRPSQKALDDLETRVLIGKAEQSELDALKKTALECDREEERIRTALEEPTRQKARLEAGIPELEAEASEILKEQYGKRFRPVVKRLGEAIRKAAEVQRELDEIRAEARSEFLGSGYVPIEAEAAFFLPDFGFRDLILSPDTPGKCSAELERIESYLNGTYEPGGIRVRGGG